MLDIWQCRWDGKGDYTFAIHTDPNTNQALNPFTQGATAYPYWFVGHSDSFLIYKKEQ